MSDGPESIEEIEADAARWRALSTLVSTAPQTVILGGYDGKRSVLIPDGRHARLLIGDTLNQVIDAVREERA